MNLPSVSAASGSIRAGKLESSTNAAGFPVQRQSPFKATTHAHQLYRRFALYILLATLSLWVRALAMLGGIFLRF